MSWNLHIVGDKVLEEVDAIGAAIVKAIEDAGHTLVSAVLTTDVGSKDITPPPAPPAEPTPAPDVPTDTPPEQPVA